MPEIIDQSTSKNIRVVFMRPGLGMSLMQSLNCEVSSKPLKVFINSKRPGNCVGFVHGIKTMIFDKEIKEHSINPELVTAFKEAVEQQSSVMT